MLITIFTEPLTGHCPGKSRAALILFQIFTPQFSDIHFNVVFPCTIILFWDVTTKIFYAFLICFTCDACPTPSNPFDL